MNTIPCSCTITPADCFFPGTHVPPGEFRPFSYSILQSSRHSFLIPSELLTLTKTSHVNAAGTPKPLFNAAPWFFFGHSNDRGCNSSATFGQRSRRRGGRKGKQIPQKLGAGRQKPGLETVNSSGTCTRTAAGKRCGYGDTTDTLASGQCWMAAPKTNEGVGSGRAGVCGDQVMWNHWSASGTSAEHGENKPVWR